MRNPLVAIALFVASCAGTGPVVRAIDRPQEPESAGRVDESSRDAGDAFLLLRLVDADTGAPVAATGVRLWRLGVPADATWKVGDHVQRVVDVDARWSRIDGLPTGRYRLQIDDQRAGAPDPPEFVVERATRVELPVRPPRRFRVHLVVVDEDGRRVERARLAVGFANGMSKNGVAPPWANPRVRVDGTPTPQGWTLIADGRGVFEKQRLDAVAGPEGFDLGEFEEDRRAESGVTDAVIEVDGCRPVDIRLAGGLHGDTTLRETAYRRR